MPDPTSRPKHSFAAPTGTRDLYPLELARRRWIEDKWRKVAVRHGFEEIDGPTFEHTELYTAKSGEGIVNEIFGTFSGKDEAAVKEMGDRLARGEKAGAPFALRPEFTPTLARMFAARGGQFAKPCKWFWQGPCFRAERPQRGRLREFWQWNVDMLGVAGDTTSPETTKAAIRRADAEVIACIADLLVNLGLTQKDIQIRINDRAALVNLLTKSGVSAANFEACFQLLDRASKLRREEFDAQAKSLSLPPELGIWFIGQSSSPDFQSSVHTENVQALFKSWEADLLPLLNEAASLGVPYDMMKLDVQIVRGLAYYTGMVFEVIVDGERAVAGGGRYDNLIETFGGPPTPAVGFGMGDVVLSLVLQDKGLMPTDKQIAADLGLRPDVFVISNGQPESDAAVGPMLAALRRKGMHARRSYKTTRNVGKLLHDAASCSARFAVIIESATEVTLKNMDDNTQEKGPTEQMLARIAP